MYKSENKKHIGNIHLILGCMFSGKTSELIRIVKRYKCIDKKVLLINYIEDNRYTESDFPVEKKVYTHDKVSYTCVSLENIEELLKMTNDYDVFAINEGQFFNNIYSVSQELCEIHNKDVIICGLDGDYKREQFKNNLLELIPIADTVNILTAYCSVCKDETPARFSKRITTETEQKVIGSTNYIPVCRYHYLH